MTLPRMTKKQMAEAARKLDHVSMTALWDENKKLRAALEHTLEMVTPDEFCEECIEARKLVEGVTSCHITFSRENYMKVLAVIAMLVLMAGCHSVTTEPGQETVIIDNPWFFGHGGVRDEAQKPGLSWYWWSTTSIPVPLTPVKYDENLDHLATADNNFINYNSYIVLQWSQPAELVKKFGYEKWYEHNLKEQYRTIVRDVTKRYQMTPIMIDPATLASIETEIAAQFRKHIESTGLHVTLVNVNMGKALPDAPVIAEMNNTAAQQQRRKTELQRKLAEDSRKDAETSRANADNAYQLAMRLDTAQFVQLESIKRYSEACKASSHCVIVQGSAPVLVGK